MINKFLTSNMNIMKTIAKSLFLMLLVASFTACQKDPLYLIDPDDNVLVYGTNTQDMIVDYDDCESYFNLAAESKGGFFGPYFTFRFRKIPYEVMGQTIDLDKTSDFTLSFEFLNKVEWFTSPEKVCGVIHDSSEGDTEYLDESPFSSGWMKFTEDNEGLIFTLHGVLRNGYTVRMKLVCPAEAE